jgi:hypothetical protein
MLVIDGYGDQIIREISRFMQKKGGRDANRWSCLMIGGGKNDVEDTETMIIVMGACVTAEMRCVLAPAADRTLVFVATNPSSPVGPLVVLKK